MAIITVASDSPSTIGGGSGDDRYVLNPALIDAGQNITITDTLGANIIQLDGDLEIASSSVTANAMLLTLSNGAVITILGADTFSFQTGGDGTTGEGGQTDTFADFVENGLGISPVPGAGDPAATGGAVTVSEDGGTSAGGSTGGGTEGQTFTLTDEADDVDGTGGDDTIVAGPVTAGPNAAGTNTLGAGDDINGGDGDADQLQIRSTFAETLFPNMQGVENIFTQNLGGGATTVDLTNTTGAMQLWNDRSVMGVEYVNVQENAIVGVRDSDVGNMVEFDEGAITDGTVSVALDEAGSALELADFGGAAPTGLVDVDVDAADSDLMDINVLVFDDSGARLNVMTTGDDAANLTISGTGDLFLEAGAGTGDIAMVDGTGLDGDLDLILGTPTDEDLMVAFGDGDDRLIVSETGFDEDDATDGGAGDGDALEVHLTGSADDLDDEDNDVVAAVNASSNFEVFNVDRWTDGGDIELDASLFTQNNFVFNDTFGGGAFVQDTLDSVIVTDVEDDDMFTIATDVLGTANFTSDGTDELNLMLMPGAGLDDPQFITNLTFNGFGDVNVMTGADQTVIDVVDADETDIIITGDGDLDINGAIGSGNEFDLTDFDGDVIDEGFVDGDIGAGTAGITDGAGNNTFLLGTGDNIVDAGEGRDQSTANTGDDIFVYDGDVDSSFFGVESVVDGVQITFAETTPARDGELLTVIGTDDQDNDTEMLAIGYTLDGTPATVAVDLTGVDTTDAGALAGAIATALDGVVGIDASANGNEVEAFSSSPNEADLELDLGTTTFMETPVVADTPDLASGGLPAVSSIPGPFGTWDISGGFVADADSIGSFLGTFPDQDDETVTVTYTIGGGAPISTPAIALGAGTDTTSASSVAAAIATALDLEAGVEATLSGGIIQYRADSGDVMSITGVTTTDPTGGDTDPFFNTDDNSDDFNIFLSGNVDSQGPAGTLDLTTFIVDDIDSDNETVKIDYTLNGGNATTGVVALDGTVNTTDLDSLGLKLAQLLNAEAGITASYDAGADELTFVGDGPVDLSIDAIIFDDPSNGVDEGAAEAPGALFTVGETVGADADQPRVVDFQIDGGAIEAGTMFLVELTQADGTIIDGAYTAVDGDNANTVRNALVADLNVDANNGGDLIAANGAAGAFTVTDTAADDGGFLVTDLDPGVITTTTFTNQLDEDNLQIDTITDFDAADDAFDFSAFFLEGAADNIFVEQINSSTQEDLDTALAAELIGAFSPDGQFALVNVLGGSGAGTYLVANTDSGIGSLGPNTGYNAFGDTVIELVGLQGTLDEDNFILS